MKAANKKGVELSINMVIIMILAVLVLLVGIGLITGVMQKLIKTVENYPTLEIPPDIDNPISFLPATMNRAIQNKMSIGFYNNEQADITTKTIPKMVCSGINNITVKALGLNIPVGSSNTYAALVTIPKSAAPGQYSCSIIISKTEKTFFMQVK